MDKQAERKYEEQQIARKLQMAEDYQEAMFEDGHSRAEHHPDIIEAPAYEAAAHTVSRDSDMLYQLDETQVDKVPFDAAQSGYGRDGTGASGRDDADGGRLGGREEELDSLEASGTPVDKNPRMKG